MRILLHLSLGFLLLAGGLLGGCRSAATPPAPTPILRFITVTPAPGPAVVPPSPTLSPSPLPGPTLAPSLPPPPGPGFSPTPVPGAFNTPTPILLTPTPARPYAVIDSPGGFLNVRAGPGPEYQPPLGSYDNGAVVEVIGKQYSAGGELWWLIPFAGSPSGQGWIFAGYTLAGNVEQVPWVAAPARPTPPVAPTPYRPPLPHAIIDSPKGFVQVRGGPGQVYEPVLGTYSNGRVVDIIGKQYAPNGELWWLIPFISGPNGGGWIYANDTIARYTDFVPWVTAPPTPTPTPTQTTTPVAPSLVDWTITGRVIDAGTSQAVAGAFVGARLGTDGPTLSATTDSTGRFIIAGQARNQGDLILNVAAQGYVQRTLPAGPKTPRLYDFPAIELSRQEAPLVTWAIFGRVTELGTARPVAGARVEAFLGVDNVRLEAVTSPNGEFSMNGQARNQGNLRLNLSAEGYQPTSFTSDQTGSRIYNLSELQLAPQAGSCRYESVINLPRAAALARLQTLSFTNVTTQTVDAGGNPNLIDRVLTQMPDPPPEGQSIRIGCQIPISLGIGKQVPSE